MFGFSFMPQLDKSGGNEQKKKAKDQPSVAATLFGFGSTKKETEHSDEEFFDCVEEPISAQFVDAEEPEEKKDNEMSGTFR